MAEPIIAPIVPNLGMQESATAASSAVIFTSTDRQIIKDRGGDLDKKKIFKDLFPEKSLTPKVENEETKPNQDLEIEVQEIERRQREHRRMLKNSPMSIKKDTVAIQSGDQETSVSYVPPNIVAAELKPPAQ